MDNRSAVEYVHAEIDKIEKNAILMHERSTILCSMSHILYVTLILLRLYRALRGVPDAELLQDDIKHRIFENEQMIQNWSRFCPQNFINNLLLVQTEIAAYISCDMPMAMHLYEQ